MSQITLANNNAVVTQSRFTVPEVYYRDQKVITTESLAVGYGADARNIQDNFSNNKDRFVEGKHYFKLEGVELHAFKNCPDNFGSVNKHARNLILWTERGASRHAKMLETDQAWDYFELLEDFYFCKKEEAEKKPNLRQSTAKELIPLRQTAERLIAHGVGNIYPDIWKHVHAEFGVQHINELLPEQIPLAISYLDALEGQFIPKEDPRENTNQRVNRDIDVHNVNALAKHYEVIYTAWKFELYPALRNIDSPIAGRLYDRFKDGYVFLRYLQESINGKRPALIN
ncbi:TPA: ORF6N domain-containing protein [Morganella morganii]|nr:ORF6N domain-containing protein [Morganella morganii]